MNDQVLTFLGHIKVNANRNIIQIGIASQGRFNVNSNRNISQIGPMKFKIGVEGSQPGQLNTPQYVTGIYILKQID
ncbi:MAG: hypothetical protein ACRDFB_02525 [Rhabdochlamydiaceae bacterium]